MGIEMGTCSRCGGTGQERPNPLRQLADALDEAGATATLYGQPVSMHDAADVIDEMRAEAAAERRGYERGVRESMESARRIAAVYCRAGEIATASHAVGAIRALIDLLDSDEARADVERLLVAMGKIASLARHMHTSPETVREVEQRVGAVIAEACGVRDVPALAARLRAMVNDGGSDG